MTRVHTSRLGERRRVRQHQRLAAGTHRLRPARDGGGRSVREKRRFVSPDGGRGFWGGICLRRRRTTHHSSSFSLGSTGLLCGVGELGDSLSLDRTDRSGAGGSVDAVVADRWKPFWGLTQESLGQPVRVRLGFFDRVGRLKPAVIRRKPAETETCVVLRTAGGWTTFGDLLDGDPCPLKLFEVEGQLFVQTYCAYQCMKAWLEPHWSQCWGDFGCISSKLSYTRNRSKP